MDHPFTREELKQIQEGQKRGTIAKIRFWRRKPDVITFRPPTQTTKGVIEAQSTPNATTPSLISTLETGQPDKFRKREKGGKEMSDN